jgi:septum formation protein
VTGVALVQVGHLVSFAERSEVTFRELTDEEIVAYIATGEPMDKAGAYGLQGGAVDFVVNIEGSRNNVIGLPTERLMKEFGLA